MPPAAGRAGPPEGGFRCISGRAGGTEMVTSQNKGGFRVGKSSCTGCCVEPARFNPVPDGRGKSLFSGFKGGS